MIWWTFCEKKRVQRDLGPVPLRIYSLNLGRGAYFLPSRSLRNPVALLSSTRDKYNAIIDGPLALDGRIRPSLLYHSWIPNIGGFRRASSPSNHEYDSLCYFALVTLLCRFFTGCLSRCHCVFSLNHSLLRGLRATIGLQGSLILDASTVLVALMFQIRSYRGLRAGSFRIKGMAVWVIFEESTPFCISFIPLRCMDHGSAFVFGPR